MAYKKTDRLGTIIRDLLIDIADWRGSYDEDRIEATLRAEQRFWAETGLYAPGRSVPPAAAGSHQEHKVREEKWREWVAEKNAELDRRIIGELAILGYDGPKGDDDDGSSV